MRKFTREEKRKEAKGIDNKVVRTRKKVLKKARKVTRNLQRKKARDVEGEG